MGLYDLWRSNGYPTYYPPRKTPVTADVLEIGLIFSIVIIAFSMFIVIPGVRGKERLFYTIRVFIGLFILGCILLVNYGQEWEVAAIHKVPTQYRAGLTEEIEADIEVKIGLHSINITLKAGDEDHKNYFDHGKVVETINYNERFHWNNLGFVQGRAGFGPFAGQFNQEYRAAQLRGLPYPILWIAEYFTLDGEWIRWGRFYRQAGFYTHAMIWLAFPLWILAMILFKMVLRYGGYMSILTGLSLICANLIFAFVRNPLQLQIPFTAEHQLIFAWGWCFWLCLVNGILSLIIGVLVVILDLKMSDPLAKFFNFDIAVEFEEFYADPAQLQEVLARDRKSRFGFTQRYKKKADKYSADANANGSTSQLEMDELGIRNPAVTNERRHFRKRTMMKSVDPNRNKQERPNPAPRKNPVSFDDTPDYENAEDARRGAAGYQGQGHSNEGYTS